MKKTLYGFNLTEAGRQVKEDAVTATEAKLGYRLPAQLTALLRQFNGGAVEGFLNVSEFLRLKEIEKLVLEIRAAPEVWYLPPDLIPFANDGSGNYYCINHQLPGYEGAVFYWDHECIERDYNPTFTAVDYPEHIEKQFDTLEQFLYDLPSSALDMDDDD